MAKMVFTQTNKVQGYVKTAHSVVLDYAVRQIKKTRLGVDKVKPKPKGRVRGCGD